MVVDKETYRLSSDNFNDTKTDKKRVIIGNTFNHDMKHFIGWGLRHNGKYKKTATYTIDKNGVIYEHFDPSFYSDYFTTGVGLNKSSIVILLENEGYLTKDEEKNIFITWTGDIYKEQTEVFTKKWREYEYWASYGDKQIESLIELICLLCDRFNIPYNAIGHNTKLSQINNEMGVIYKSNLDYYYMDPNPNLDYELIKNKIEKYETKH